jgi:DNA-binding HxlR family transcriptional regulator
MILLSKRIAISFWIVKKLTMFKNREHNSEACLLSISAVRDSLYVLNGKWKLPVIVCLSNGPKRFNEIQRALADITPKVLSKELRELELNEFIERKVYNTVPVTVTYELTPYSDSVGPIIEALKDWGVQHRERLIKTRKSETTAATL